MKKNSHTKTAANLERKEIIITRDFDAPKEIVFKTWTEPDRIKKWWGPKGFTAPIVKVDLRKGGKYLYAMQDESGKKYWSAGEFREIDAPDKIVITDYFSNEKGEKMNPEDYGLSPEFPKESIVTIKFEEHKGGTKLSIIYELPKSAAAREAIQKSRMDEGWNSSLDKLAEAIA